MNVLSTISSIEFSFRNYIFTLGFTLFSNQTNRCDKGQPNSGLMRWLHSWEWRETLQLITHTLSLACLVWFCSLPFSPQLGNQKLNLFSFPVTAKTKFFSLHISYWKERGLDDDDPKESQTHSLPSQPVEMKLDKQKPSQKKIQQQQQQLHNIFTLIKHKIQRQRR